MGDDRKHRWELSKENIQPIKSGHRVESLNESLLRMHDDKHRKELRQEQANFEYRLREYTGDDPLEVYYEYMKWMRAKFPSGGKELTAVLTNLLKEFQDDSRYANDTRYISAWMSYIETAEDKLPLFRSLFDKGIGTMNAEFYIAWATAYEAANNFKKAREIYDHGILCGAEPRTLLQHKFEQFKRKEFANVMAAGRLGEGSGSTDPEAREAMTSLKFSRVDDRGAVVDPIRVGPEAVLSQRSGVGQLLGATSDHEANVDIYSDTFVAGMPRGAGGAEYTLALNTPAAHSTRIMDKLITESTFKKENVLPASRWNDVALPTERANRVAEPENHQENPSFQIFADEESITQNKECVSKDIRPIHNAKPLRCVEVTPSATNPLVKASGKTGSRERYMYPKDEIYAGPAEKSLEELRFLRWKAAFPEKAVILEEEIESRRVKRNPLNEQIKPLAKEVDGQKAKMMVNMNDLYPNGQSEKEFSFEELRVMRLNRQQSSGVSEQLER